MVVAKLVSEDGIVVLRMVILISLFIISDENRNHKANFYQVKILSSEKIKTKDLNTDFAD